MRWTENTRQRRAALLVVFIQACSVDEQPAVGSESPLDESSGDGTSSDADRSSAVAPTENGLDVTNMLEFCRQRAVQLCAFATSCCAITDEQPCVAWAEAACIKTIEETLGEDVELVAERAQACLAAEKAAWFPTSCEVPPTSSASTIAALDTCKRIEIGKLPLGAACTRDTECADTSSGDGHCALSEQDQGSCVEALTVGEGEACLSVGTVCGSNLYCDSTDGACRQLKADGAQCAAHAECRVGFCDPNQKVCPVLTRDTLCSSYEAALN